MVDGGTGRGRQGPKSHHSTPGDGITTPETVSVKKGRADLADGGKGCAPDHSAAQGLPEYFKM